MWRDPRVDCPTGCRWIWSRVAWWKRSKTGLGFCPKNCGGLFSTIAVCTSGRETWPFCSKKLLAFGDGEFCSKKFWLCPKKLKLVGLFWSTTTAVVEFLAKWWTKICCPTDWDAEFCPKKLVCRPIWKCLGSKPSICGEGRNGFGSAKLICLLKIQFYKYYFGAEMGCKPQPLGILRIDCLNLLPFDMLTFCLSLV